MQKETVFKHKVLHFMRTLPHTWVTKIQQVVIRGTPDILACIRGTFVAIELKSTEDSVIAALQVFNLDSIKKAGGISLVITPETWFNDKKFLEDLANNHREIY